LKHDEDLIDDIELTEELQKVRALQLQVLYNVSYLIRLLQFSKDPFQSKEMGFSKSQTENAIKQHGTVQAALEAILSYANSDCKQPTIPICSYLTL
jgi:hypothetical protein